MDIDKKIFGQLAEAILDGGARKATKYITDRLVVKATRKLFGGKIDKRNKTVEILFTLGGPNYEEREFIKKAKSAGEPFPVKKLLLKFPKGI